MAVIFPKSSDIILKVLGAAVGLGVVAGAGAWGTALAIQAARAGNRVVLLARDVAAAMVERSRQEQPYKLAWAHYALARASDRAGDTAASAAADG